MQGIGKQMLDTLIINARIITMNDNCPVIERGVVGVSGNKIAFVGESIPENTTASRVIDCSGGILMPGLVNTHAHTAMCIMRGYADDYTLQDWLFKKVFPAEERLDERAIVAGARLGFAEMFRTGTTSVSDMYFYQPSVARLAVECGMRASLSNAVIALDADSYNPDNDRAICETYKLIENWHNAADGLIRADVSIHAEYTSAPKIWRFVEDIAKKNDIVMHTHVSETQKDHLECKAKYGLTPVQVMHREGMFTVKTLAAHCVWVEEADMQILSDCGVSVAHNPVSNLKLASGIADINALLDYGVNISLGTDGCCSNYSHDMFEELKLSALLAKYRSGDASTLPAYQALKFATVNGAKAQGRENLGMLKEGYCADMILLDSEALSLVPSYDVISSVVYGANGRDVVLTMINGRIVYDHGVFPTIDIEYAKSEVNDYAKHIVLSVE